MVAVRWQPKVELGFENSPSLLVTGVYKNSPAEKAGLRQGDRILAIDGQSLGDGSSLFKVYRPHEPGDTVSLTVARPGRTAPITLTGVFRRRQQRANEGQITEIFAEEVRNSFPVPFVVVGLAVLFLRVEDPKVWLLALLFASFVGTPSFPDEALAPALRTFALAYKAVFLGMLGPLFYFFFSVFPAGSPVDRRLPWLKWVALALGGLAAYDIRPDPPFAKLVGSGIDEKGIFTFIFSFMILGLVSLATNYFRTPDPETRRKVRVIFWGTLTGMAPALLTSAARSFAAFQSPPWLTTAVDVFLFIFPLSFAYAVVKHRVLEIPVLLKRSARYVLVQRGFIVLLALASISLTVIFASSLARYLQPVIEAAQPAGVALGAVFGTALLWGGAQVHKRVSMRIDRAFFRSAYDARMILEDLAEQTRTATGRVELAQLLQAHLRKALQPSFLLVYVRGRDSQLSLISGQAPAELAALPANLPALAKVERYGRPWEVPQAAGPTDDSKSVLSLLHPDCLAPMLGRDGRLLGLLVLGPRLSEEPYSGEDKRLLASVASQAGTALENIGLAEQIAERMETERRVAREMDIAKEVQARLLPQAPPPLKTLDSAAQCIQARAVGGDYYDFLDLGPERIGFVLADVSGKGVHAALLMANLQAHLRSQSSIQPLEPVAMLQQVNGMLWKATAARHFATLFFGVYDDSARRLLYVNCGHNPPVLLHPDGTVERLAATATVIGAFPRWDCSAEERELGPGDLLAVFSDGVTEAACNEEEFGETRLIDELLARRRLPVNEIITAILGSVQEFSAGAQSDDLTLLIARVRA